LEHTQGPVELLEQADAQRIARQLLEQLSKKRDREILQRYYLEEEEKDTICEDMELTDLHFNRVIHRAKQRLRLLAESMGITL
jgi:RNA polymerase sigma-70 factor (ECF subfamily)